MGFLGPMPIPIQGSKKIPISNTVTNILNVIINTCNKNTL